MTGAATRTVGRSIKELRRLHGCSLHQLALRTGGSASYLSSVERGQQSPTIDYLAHVAAALEVDLIELFLTDAATCHPPQVPCRFGRTCPLLDEFDAAFKEIAAHAAQALHRVEESRGEAEPPREAAKE